MILVRFPNVTSLLISYIVVTVFVDLSLRTTASALSVVLILQLYMTYRLFVCIDHAIDCQ